MKVTCFCEASILPQYSQPIFLSPSPREIKIHSLHPRIWAAFSLLCPALESAWTGSVDLSEQSPRHLDVSAYADISFARVRPLAWCQCTSSIRISSADDIWEQFLCSQRPPPMFSAFASGLTIAVLENNYMVRPVRAGFRNGKRSNYAARNTLCFDPLASRSRGECLNPSANIYIKPIRLSGSQLWWANL
jgi:hypothetical protein